MIEVTRRGVLKSVGVGGSGLGVVKSVNCVGGRDPSSIDESDLEERIDIHARVADIRNRGELIEFRTDPTVIAAVKFDHVGEVQRNVSTLDCIKLGGRVTHLADESGGVLLENGIPL